MKKSILAEMVQHFEAEVKEKEEELVEKVEGGLLLRGDVLGWTTELFSGIMEALLYSP